MSTTSPASPHSEARRLSTLTPPIARAQLGDRISRTFLLEKTNPQGFKKALAFNAHLSTELAQMFPAIWK